MGKIKQFIKKPLFWIITAAVVVGLLIIIFSSGSDNKYDYIEAARGKMVQEVSVTGDVQPIEGVNLAFEKSGRIDRVAVGVGDEVYRGEPLILLGVSDLYAELNETKANLESEEAKLAELKRGPTTYEIEVKESEVEEAEQTLANKYGSVVVTVQDAYAQADGAVRTKTAELFDGSKSGYTLKYNACNSSAENLANFYRLISENMLDDWREEINSLSASLSRSESLEVLDTAKDNLTTINQFLDYIGDTLTVGCELTGSTVSAYRLKISTARDNINTSLAEINTLEQGIALKEVTLNKEEREFDKLLAGASEEELAIQQAAVNRAEASVDNIKAQIEKAILRAPFSGKITKVDAERGEVADAYKEIVSVISESGFKIEVNIPEVDISKVEVGDLAGVTLDAYGNDVMFNAEVITIDLAETVIEGVSTYGAILEFKEPDERIKSGMTANVDIVTGAREDVVYIPQRSVIQEDGRKFVRVLKDEEVEEREVVLGMKDSMGNIEVKEGIEEGEKVVIFINESR